MWGFLGFGDKKIIVDSSWPKVDANMIDDKVESEILFVMSIITAIRNLKSDLNISPKKEINLICRGAKEKTQIILGKFVKRAI